MTEEKPVNAPRPAEPLSYAPIVPQPRRGLLVLGWICLLGVAGVFLYAGIEKIVEPRQFVIAIKNYRMVPEQLLNAQALYLPWVEVLAALALLLPQTRKAGAGLIIAMLLMFIAAVSYAALYKGYNIDCGCFGKGSSKAGLRTIGFDSALLIATIVGVVFSTPRRKNVPIKI